MRSLLALAKKLRVDAEAMIETVKAEKDALAVHREEPH